MTRFERFHIPAPMLRAARSWVAAAVVLGLAVGGCQWLGGRTPEDSRYTEAQLASYARAILEIEPLRQDAVARIEDLPGVEQSPAIACSDRDSINNLAPAAREIAESLCEQSLEIVQGNDLEIITFNNITLDVRQDPELKAKVQQYIQEIQEELNRDQTPTKDAAAIE